MAADGVSSDGIGVMTGVPRKLLLDETGVSLAEQARTTPLASSTSSLTGEAGADLSQ